MPMLSLVQIDNPEVCLAPTVFWPVGRALSGLSFDFPPLPVIIRNDRDRSVLQDLVKA
ncbi:MAG: hypothetical protein WA705_07340 [Candidatus Ozemobacteraceae bacterium]